MDSDDWPGLLLLAVALALLALVTAAETAVASSHRVRPRSPAEKGPFRSQSLPGYLRESREVYSTLALARNLAIVGSTAIVVYLVLRQAGLNWATLAVTFIITLAGLVLIQTVPRLVVAANPQRWAAYLGPFVTLTRILLRPAAAVLDLPARLLLRGHRPANGTEAPATDTEELLSLAEMKDGAGAMDAEEREMIRGIMALEETTAREIMVPRTDIVAVPSDASFEEVARIIVDRGYSRIPVFEDTIDNITGVVYAREVLGFLANSKKPADLRSLARPPHFVPESKRVDELLAEMQRNKLSIAIVVDEYGGTAGLVTVEDLLEEIVGEIVDEFDRDEETIHRISDSEAILDARVGVDELEELFGVKVEEGDFDSVGGFILSHLGKMPTVGEEVRVDGLLVRILSVSGRRIKRVRVIKEQPPVTGDSTTPA